MSPKKLNKFPVNYRTPGWVTRDFLKMCCGTCTRFEGSTCTLVAGEIRRDDLCDRWDPKR